MSKGIPYEALMTLSPEQIAEAFPNGARETGGRWTPADTPENASKSLKQLLKDKKDRQEKPRFLAARGPRNHLTYNRRTKRWESRAWDPDEEKGYTDVPAFGIPGESQCVDEETQERFTKEAHGKFRILHAEEQARADLRSLLASLRQIGIEAAKAGMDPVEAVARAAGQKAQERRKEAA